MTLIPGDISFDEATYSISEEELSLTIPVNRSNGNAPVEISYATSDGTAIAGVDYTESVGTLTFNPNETKKNIVLDIAVGEDRIFDGDKNLTVTLVNPTNGAMLGTWSSALITINDNDNDAVAVVGTGTLDLENTTYSVNEDAGKLTVNVRRTDGLEGDLNVTVTLGGNAISLGNNPATYLDDYRLDSGSQVNFGRLTLLAGVELSGFDVLITNDTDVEGDEKFQITLSSPEGGAILGSQITAVATIVDNDSAPSENPVGGNGETPNNSTGDESSSEESGGGLSPAILLIVLLLMLAFRRRTFS